MGWILTAREIGQRAKEKPSSSEQATPLLRLAFDFGEHHLQLSLVRRETPRAFVHLDLAAERAIDHRLPADGDEESRRLELDADVLLAGSGGFYGDPHVNGLVLLAPVPLAASSLLLRVVVGTLAAALATHAAHAAHAAHHVVHATALAAALAEHGHQRRHVHAAGAARTAGATSHASHHL